METTTRVSRLATPSAGTANTDGFRRDRVVDCFFSLRERDEPNKNVYRPEKTADEHETPRHRHVGFGPNEKTRERRVLSPSSFVIHVCVPYVTEPMFADRTALRIGSVMVIFAFEKSKSEDFFFFSFFLRFRNVFGVSFDCFTSYSVLGKKSFRHSLSTPHYNHSL